MNYVIRSAEKNDLEGVKNLWSHVFDDSKEFVDWFYKNRYHRAFTTCLETDGKIVSAMQSYPLNIRIRGRIIPASILAGVSTYDEYRGKGFMSYVFKAHMHQVRNSGIALVPHTPANTPTFFSKGHYVISTNLRVTIPGKNKTNITQDKLLSDINEDYGNMFKCYTKWSYPYSGIVARSLSDFVLKMEDYSVDQSKCSLLLEGNEIKAYCIYYEFRDYIFCEETAYDSLNSLHKLLSNLIDTCKEVRIKLPPDADIHFDGMTTETKLQGVLGVANMQMFLNYMFRCLSSELNDIRIEIKDKIVSENESIYFLNGTKSDLTPHLTVSAGHFAQVLCGFITLDELGNEDITIYDNEKFNILNNALPKEKCFIVDEY